MKEEQQMWIRSQDRKTLVNADKFSISKEHEVFRIYSVNSFLGEYSAEENAMKVMDMIQNAITGTRFEFTDIVRDCDLAGIEIHNVFNMPQDDKVKV